MEKFPVDELLDRWSKAWTSGDAGALAELWDSRYPSLTFLATERDRWLRTHEQIGNYYRFMLSLFVPDTWICSDVFVDRLSDDTALVRCKVHMDYRLPEFEGENDSVWRARCCQVWRHGDSGWKLIHKEDSTNEFDRAVNLGRRLADGAPKEDVLKVWEVWTAVLRDLVNS